MNDTRKLILRALLICLAVTAVAGVLSVLSSNRMMSSVTGTGFFATVCAALMLSIATRMDKPNEQAAAMFGLVLVVIEFVLIMAIVWEIPRMFGFSLRDERLPLTCVVLGGWGIAAMVCLRLYPTPFSRVAGITGLVCTAVSMLVALVAVWSPDQHRYYDNGHWWAIAMTIVGLGVPLTMAVIGIGTPVGNWAGTKPEPVSGSLRPWRWFAFVAAPVAMVVFIASIWHEDEWLARLGGIICLIAVATGYANVVLLATLTPAQIWLGRLTLTLAIITCAAYGLLFLQPRVDGSFFRPLSALLILTACGSLALIAMTRLNARTTFTQSYSSDIRIALTCPRCQLAQQVKLGGDECDQCGLKIEVKVEEPRCVQCGYLLYMLDSPQCPECGTAIALVKA